MDGRGTVNGYSVAGYDIRSLSNAIATEIDRVGEQLRQLRASEVTSTDLGEEVGARYVAVVHGTLADSLAEFRSASERLAEQLSSTLERIESADEEGSAAFGRLREEAT